MKRHTFEIELTPEQSKIVTKNWHKHGGFGGAMFGQPNTIKNDLYSKVKFAILDEDTAGKVHIALNSK